MNIEEFTLITIFFYRALSVEQYAMLLYDSMDQLDDKDVVFIDKHELGWRSVQSYAEHVLERMTNEGKTEIVRDSKNNTRLPCPPAYVPTKLGARRARAAIKRCVEPITVTERIPAKQYRRIISPGFLSHQFYLNELLIRINTVFTNRLTDAICWNDNFMVEGNELRPDACIYVPAVEDLGIPKTYFFLENDMATVNTNRTSDKFEEYCRMFSSFFWEPDARYVVLFAVNDVPYTEGLQEDYRHTHKVNLHTYDRVDNLRGKMIESLWNQFDRNVEAYVGTTLDILNVVERVYLPEYLGICTDDDIQLRNCRVFDFRHGALSVVPALYNYCKNAQDGALCPVVALTPSKQVMPTRLFNFELHSQRFFNAFGFLLLPYSEYFKFY